MTKFIRIRDVHMGMGMPWDTDWDCGHSGNLCGVEIIYAWKV